MEAAVTFGLESPFPAAEAGHRTTSTRDEELTDKWHESFPTSPRSARRCTRRWSATRRCSTSARTSRRTDEDPFLQAFGADRVRVTPISETAEIGLAVGAAFAGHRPVVQLYMSEFMLVAMNQVVNEAPRFHYMTAGPGEGADRAPGRLRLYGRLGGPAHGNDLRDVHGRAGPEGGGAVDGGRAKGLMTASIRDDNPVVFFHHYLLTLEHGDVPEGEHVVPLGEAAVRREGSDVTIVGIGWTVDPRACRCRAARRRGRRAPR